MSARLCTLWAIILAAACAPPLPVATFHTFTLEMESPSAGAELAPTDRVKLHIIYAGDLARSLGVDVAITDTVTNETVTLGFLPGAKEEDRFFDVHTFWTLVHERFKRPGRYVVTMTASITATIRGSKPWTTAPVSFVVNATPMLDAVTVSPITVGAPTPYGTEQTITVTGSGLWDDVNLAIVDLARGRMLTADVVGPLPFDREKTSLATPVTIRDSGSSPSAFTRCRSWPPSDPSRCDRRPSTSRSHTWLTRCTCRGGTRAIRATGRTGRCASTR
jgi:hypothetical protein